MGASLLSTIPLIHLSQILASTFCLFCQTMALKKLSTCFLEIEKTSINIGLSQGYHRMSIMRFMQKYLHGQWPPYIAYLYQNCPTKQYVKSFHFQNVTRTILLQNGSSSPDSTCLPVIIPIIQDKTPAIALNHRQQAH